MYIRKIENSKCINIIFTLSEFLLSEIIGLILDSVNMEKIPIYSDGEKTFIKIANKTYRYCRNNSQGDDLQDLVILESPLNTSLGVWNSFNTPNNLTELVFPSYVISIACGEQHGIAILSDNTVNIWGHPLFGYKTTPQKLPLKDIISVDCGCFYTMFLDKNNEVWVHGSNLAGQLGVGHKK